MHPHRPPHPPGRRRFLATALGAAATLPLPALARSGAQGKLRFGAISDIHHDVMHDGMQRLAAFLEAMREAKPDFIVQLGDFCKPTAANRPFLDLWNSHDGPRHHVIGNHDMDGGFQREQTVAWYGMPGRHYAFDRGGVRFLVLDGNDPGGTKGGYHRFIADDQKAWLEGELAAARAPVIVFIHQPLDLPGGVANQREIRAVLEKGRGPDHAGVAAVFSGHCHQDCVNRINGIAHVQINSASYVWLPANSRRNVYDEASHRKHPYLDHVAPYRDPLWALVTLDLDAGTLAVEGRATEWVGPDPWARGAPENDYPRDKNRPAISHWNGPVREPA
jgi:3',5'-cyclic AMP phosphodiesterase CpdA